MPTRPGESSCDQGREAPIGFSPFFDRSKQLLERLNSQTCVSDETAHGERVDGVVSRDSEDAPAVGHDDVLPFSNDPEAF